MLQLESVTKQFGGIRALDGVSLTVGEGEVVALIGPNGSGKSTLVNVATALVPATSGRVLFRGKDITHEKSHRVVAAGMIRTFQNIRLFPSLPVWQNLWVAQNSAEDGRRGFFFEVAERGSRVEEGHR